jgi:iron transport multicopper oxidase
MKLTALGAPTPQSLDITVQGGGKAGIWQSGMGLASDSNRVFLVTGYAHLSYSTS